ncbi:MAG: bifunctional ADP-dependent NAD(P)H-hydrate dehydratase/NAD(P)H-hydrate epimerase [Rhodospirillaceae bacterium TMED8]|nr:bifunctional ADP-dependent NAD(P)H-hydrate dehydratase/NAD(P)H-hydrate epimerase [Magnetovibrio sp.]OUT49652.1 MAG: bifunctional ADP-dependent NAD(P)H-hydrate dehydratase/NAD(P)H-hydrate epimerase [Rhodospirillaceae bacterium TMED8]|tara:strand:+ start:1639 stop:3126 length:1488 start_codon:yes stop_codon:yes gene_type:complete
MSKYSVLTIEEMYHADKLTIKAGIPSLELMEAAGRGIASVVMEQWMPRPLTVLCGPGNNGGDGYVAARLLMEAGWPVTLAQLGDPGALRADAATNRDRWKGYNRAFSTNCIKDSELVIDALFGAGLSKPIEGVAAEVIEAINMHRLPCVSVDVPSGIHGNTGEVMGIAPYATITTTFFRQKPAHLLVPGRLYCGSVRVIDIGILESTLEAINPKIFVNDPALWGQSFTWPLTDGHKYNRGHAVIAGGAEMTGAARLAALAARRIGAGLVTIAAPSRAMSVYAADKPGNLVNCTDDDNAFQDFFTDPRFNAALIGPGTGVNSSTQSKALSMLKARKNCVLDADALTVFADNPKTLFNAIHSPVILTPHEKEFQQLFGEEVKNNINSATKFARASEAAAMSNAVVILKGADTVIAAPNGEAVINATGTPFLATAGSGDVLAGMITGLLTQGMPAFKASCAAVWLHGIAAELFGPGLIAEDLIDKIPGTLRRLVDSEV